MIIEALFEELGHHKHRIHSKRVCQPGLNSCDVDLSRSERSGNPLDDPIGKLSDVITNTCDGIQNPLDPRRFALVQSRSWLLTSGFSHRGLTHLFPCIARSLSGIARSSSSMASHGLSHSLALMDSFFFLNHSALMHFTLVSETDTGELRLLDEAHLLHRNPYVS
ncbi:unnamed protein product [Cuscuta campestris]|uniref:Uncharacterized protein n=1 Tax=Cuscuta campestris TaxID=132261 RepID=A0A484M1Z9_9ASTE|nr:unnamed protein product [Cuscuta campestris]